MTAIAETLNWGGGVVSCGLTPTHHTTTPHLFGVSGCRKNSTAGPAIPSHPRIRWFWLLSRAPAAARSTMSIVATAAMNRGGRLGVSWKSLANPAASSCASVRIVDPCGVCAITRPALPLALASRSTTGSVVVLPDRCPLPRRTASLVLRSQRRGSPSGRNKVRQWSAVDGWLLESASRSCTRVYGNYVGSGQRHKNHQGYARNAVVKR